MRLIRPVWLTHSGEKKDFEVYSCHVSPDGSRLVTAAGGMLDLARRFPFTDLGPYRWIRSGVVNRCYIQCGGTRLLQAQAIGLHELSYWNNTHSQVLWEWTVSCFWGRR